MRKVVVDPVFSWGIVMISVVLACFDLILVANFSLHFDLTLEIPCFTMLEF